jgi:hypothetical protein
MGRLAGLRQEVQAPGRTGVMNPGQTFWYLLRH